MKLKKYLLPSLLAACGFTASVSAAEGHHNTDGGRTAFGTEGYGTVRESRESAQDPKALADFVRQKGMVSIQEKGGGLMLGGDIRTEWDHIHSQNGSHHLRGHDAKEHHVPLPTNEFDVEVNLVMDYKADRSWGKIQVQYDNAAGVPIRGANELGEGYVSHKNTLFGSGTLNKVALRKAYMGYNVVEAGTSRFDVEVGRRRLYDVFDSQVQFYSLFDGLTLKYANSVEGVADFHVKAAAFVIDQNANHFGWVGEIGLLNLGDEGLDAKYSMIRWNKAGRNRYGHKNCHGHEFKISQFLLAYNFSPDFLRHKTQVYGAFLRNHDARNHHGAQGKKEANAWYAGVKIGEIKRQGDWSVGASYQWVQPYAIPEGDVRGIGRDNPKNISLYASKKHGFANYKGYEVEGLYNLTDNLTLEAAYSRVHQCTHRVGGKHRASVFALSTIYSF